MIGTETRTQLVYPLRTFACQGDHHAVNGAVLMVPPEQGDVGPLEAVRVARLRTLV